MKLSIEKIVNVLNYLNVVFQQMFMKYLIKNYGHHKEFFLVIFIYIMEKLQSLFLTLYFNFIIEKNKIFVFFDRLASSLVSPSATYYTQLFATGDSKGAIRLWDINQFQKSLIFRPSRAIRGTGMSTNDEIILYIFIFLLLASSVRGLAFTSDNNLNLASLNENGQLNIFE